MAKKTEAKKSETKTEKFRRLAINRVSKALKAMSLVGNLSGGGYEYTQEDVNKIFSAFNTRLKETYDKFQPRKKGEMKKDEFTL